MAGVKISQLTPGGAIQSVDELPISRAGIETYKILASQIVTDGANIGGGSAQIFADKITSNSTTLRFRSLSGDEGINFRNVDGTIVVSTSGQNPIKTTFYGNGISLTYPINGNFSVNPNNYRVDIDGVLQEPITDYYVVGSNIVFTSAPPLSSKVVVVANNIIPAYDVIPSDGSVTSNKIALSAVTTEKIANNAITAAQLSINSVTTDKLALSSVTNARLAFDGGAFGFRNKVINGNFDIWQRGTSYTGNVTTPITYPAADRWVVYGFMPTANSPSGTYTVTQRTTNNTELQYFQANYYQRLQTNITTFGTTPMTSYLSSSFITPGIQQIENAASILGKTVTVSFWARSSQNSKLLSESQIFANTPSLFWTPTICKVFDITTSWQKFTHTYTMPTYNQVVAAGYNPLLNYGSNPSYTPLGGALPSLSAWLYQVNFATMWSRGIYNAAGNHTNRPAGFPDPLSETDYQALLASAEATKNGGWIDIAQVQLEEGPVATPFEQRPIGLELSLCQRYYQRYGAINIQGWATTDTSVAYATPLSVRMRIDPIANFTLGATGPAGGVNTSSIFTAVGASADVMYVRAGALNTDKMISANFSNITFNSEL